MRKFILFIIVALFVNIGHAQTLKVSEISNTSSNSSNQFLVAGHQITINNNFPSFVNSGEAFGINMITAISASVNEKSVIIYAGNGKELFSSPFNLQNDDSSVKVYVKPNGGFIVRENVANFLFYDTFGNVKQSVSNSSQSREGESISELAADPAFKTVVLYNPKIVQNGVEGSRARIVTGNWTNRDIYYSEERSLRFVKVSKNGQYVAITSYKSGTDDEVQIFDRFGNELGEFSFDQGVTDVKITEEGKYLTIRSNGRAGVYSVLTGDRIGSTSFRSKLQFAEYVPQDNMIIALTADETGSTLSNVEIHAINLEARSIDRQEYSSELGISELVTMELRRRGAQSYTLTGLSKSLNLDL